MYLSFFVSAPTTAAMATPSGTSVSNGVYVPSGIANGDVKPVITTTPLADFLMQLEDYTPTVSQTPLIGVMLVKQNTKCT